MPRYEYAGRDERGELVRDAIDAETRFDALSLLRAQGLTVVELQAPGTEDAWRDSRPPAVPSGRRRRAPRVSFGGRVSASDKAVFCRQISISVSSGVALRETLASIAQDMENPAFQRVLRGVLDRLDEGHSFSQALAAYENVFGRLFVALMRSAEESGSMTETLEHLSGSLERAERLARKIRSVAAYPVFVMSVFAIICVIMTLWVLPKLQESFSSLDAKLPLLTRAVFGFNQFIVDHIVVIGLAIAGVVLLASVYRRTSAGKRFFDNLRLRMPFFGACTKMFSLARVCRNLGVMLRGGVPVTTAIEITAQICENHVLEDALLAARAGILEGSNIADSLGKQGVFPSLVVRMVHVGESSGRLPQVLEKVSETYEDQAEGAIMLAMSLLEPLMICIFGVVVLGLVLAIYLPAFTMGQHVGGG